MNPPNNEPKLKTHKLVWIKVTNENAIDLDKLASKWSLTRASLCRLIVLQFLSEENPSLNITNTDAK
jgi:hypothetical protein